MFGETMSVVGTGKKISAEDAETGRSKTKDLTRRMISAQRFLFGETMSVAGTGKKISAEDAETRRSKTNELTREIIGAAMRVHAVLGPGLLESAYEACLKT